MLLVGRVEEEEGWEGCDGGIGASKVGISYLGKETIELMCQYMI